MIINDKHIIEELRSILLTSGMTDKELAHKSNMSKEGVYKIRSGKTNSIRSSNAKSLLQVCGFKLSTEGKKLTINPVNFEGTIGMELAERIIDSQLEQITELKKVKSELLKKVENMEKEVKSLKEDLTKSLKMYKA